MRNRLSDFPAEGSSSGDQAGSLFTVFVHDLETGMKAMAGEEHPVVCVSSAGL